MSITTALTRRTVAIAAGLAAAASGLAAGPATATPPKVPRYVEIDVPGGPIIQMGDINGDGRYDVFVFDLDRDGRPDVGVLDRDFDGMFEHRWLDGRERDGRPSKGEFKKFRYKRHQRGCSTPRRVSRRHRCHRNPQIVLGLSVLPRRFMLAPRHPVQQPPAPQQPQQQPQQQQQQPAPQPAPAPSPAPGNDRTPINHAADVNGDGQNEVFTGNGTLRPHQSQLHDTTGQDEVVLGTADGGKLKTSANVDDDPGKDRQDAEVVMEDPNRAPFESTGVDLDNDGDIDIVVVGTGGGAQLTEVADLDMDGDIDIVVEDPNRYPSASTTIDVDGDGDPDICIQGTR